MSKFKEGQPHYIRMSDLMLSNYKTLEKSYANKSKVRNGISTGFEQLDSLTQGLKKGGVTIVGGRPHMGKTMLLANIARHVGTKSVDSGAVLIFSLEKEAEDFSMSMLAAQSEVEMSKLKTGRFSSSNWRSLAHASGNLAESSIFVSEESPISIEDIHERCCEVNDIEPLGLVVIDSLQLIQGFDWSHKRQSNVLNIVSELKRLAMKLNVQILISTRTAMPSVRRKENRPCLDDLPGGLGLIEREADLILFLHREEMFSRIPENEGLVEIIIAQQKNGPSQSIRVDLYPDIHRMNQIYDDRYLNELYPE